MSERSSQNFLESGGLVSLQRRACPGSSIDRSHAFAREQRGLPHSSEINLAKSLVRQGMLNFFLIFSTLGPITHTRTVKSTIRIRSIVVSTTSTEFRVFLWMRCYDHQLSPLWCSGMGGNDGARSIGMVVR